MKIEARIPAGWRSLVEGEKIIHGDMWIILDDAKVGTDWYKAYHRDSDASMVGHRWKATDETLFIRQICLGGPFNTTPKKKASKCLSKS